MPTLELSSTDQALIEAHREHLRVFGWDEVGAMLVTVPLGAREAQDLAFDIERTGRWHILGSSREGSCFSVYLGRTPLRTRACPRCRGLGFRAAYLHVSSGRCFACDGQGRQPQSFPSPASSVGSASEGR